MFFGLLNANCLLVMRLCAYYGGFADWWREAHLEAHKSVRHFFANRPPGAGNFFSNLIKMLVTGITTIVSPNRNVKAKLAADCKWLNLK